MKGKFYGIGVGPGDPDLLTLKAVEILKHVDVVVCPEARKGEGSFALQIAEKWLPKGAETLSMEFPMVHDAEILQKAWVKNAEVIKAETAKGRNLAFLTLGDPTVYSTYMYLVPFVKAAGVEVETIPGITSFTAVASRLNLPLTTADETLAIVPLMKGCESARVALENFDNCVIMKASHDNQKLGEILEDMGLQESFVLISKCGTEDESVMTSIDELKGDKVPYLSTMIVKKKGVRHE